MKGKNGVLRGANGKSSEDDDAATEALAMQMETLDNTKATTAEGQVGLPRPTLFCP